MSASLPAPLAAPVESIVGIWRFDRGPHLHNRCRSLPGHLLHLVLSGRYDLRANGRAYAIRPGDIIYYHESEEVEWIGGPESVTFYSVGYHAPLLPPLPIDRRVFPAGKRVRAAFGRLYQASLQAHGLAGRLAAHGTLLEILGEIYRCVADHARPKPAVGRWWDAERRVRETKRFRMTVEELTDLLHCSRTSVVRLCKKATGQTPHQRIRAIRMEEAKGLLLYSSLKITEVAAYLGYGRVHEFSREFATVFGEAPTAMRNRGGKPSDP